SDEEPNLSARIGGSAPAPHLLACPTSRFSRFRLPHRISSMSQGKDHMPTCRICQQTFKFLKFQTEHIDICSRCVNSLNKSPEPAKNAEARFSEKLKRGMQRNAERDLRSEEGWKRQKAEQTLSNLEAAVAAKLNDWLTKLLSDRNNSTRDFNIMRAYSRGHI